MANTITLSQTAYKNLLARMDKLERMIGVLLERFEQEPPYGSNAWWEWSIKKGKEAIKRGEYVEVTTDKQRRDFFKSL